MLSMRECEVQELVRLERLRESEHQRLVNQVSRQNESRFRNFLEQLQNRSNHLRQRNENQSLVS